MVMQYRFNQGPMAAARIGQILRHLWWSSSSPTTDGLLQQEDLESHRKVAQLGELWCLPPGPEWNKDVLSQTGHVLGELRQYYYSKPPSRWRIDDVSRRVMAT